jgi:hypothetical protein
MGESHIFLTEEQAKRLLSRLEAEGRLVRHGERRGAFYTLGANAKI